MSWQKVKDAPKKRILSSSGLTMQHAACWGSSFRASNGHFKQINICKHQRNHAFSNLQLNPTAGQIAQKRPWNVDTSRCSGITLAPVHHVGVQNRAFCRLLALASFRWRCPKCKTRFVKIGLLSEKSFSLRPPSASYGYFELMINCFLQGWERNSEPLQCPPGRDFEVTSLRSL